VRLTGVVVAVDNFSGRMVYTLDDSSGICIECTCPAPSEQQPATNPNIPNHLNQNSAVANAFLNPAPIVVKNQTKEAVEPLPAPSVTTPLVPWDDVDVGVVVKVKGRIGKDWGQKSIEVIKIEIIRSTDQEVRCWNEVLAFKEDILREPWVVSEEEEKQCRKRAMREKQWKGGKTKEEREGKYKDPKTGKRGAEDERQRRREESDEHKRKRKEKEGEEIEHEVKRQKDRDGQGLNPKNKINYPSLAVRRRAAGKYDALGI
jgi:hypothetical protein